jgi:LDH2 family malate/lactate/ureidoglycolate dehydrogenase
MVTPVLAITQTTAIQTHGVRTLERMLDAIKKGSFFCDVDTLLIGDFPIRYYNIIETP